MDSRINVCLLRMCATQDPMSVETLLDSSAITPIHLCHFLLLLQCEHVAQGTTGHLYRLVIIAYYAYGTQISDDIASFAATARFYFFLLLVGFIRSPRCGKRGLRRQVLLLQ